eukprot:9179533-Pyramimonas_sp.AAC.1
MTRGAAHQEDEHNNHRSLSTRQVFLEWQVAPTAIELLVRKLSWCKFEQQAAMINRPVSAGTLNSQGEISADPN